MKIINPRRFLQEHQSSDEMMSKPLFDEWNLIIDYKMNSGERCKKCKFEVLFKFIISTNVSEYFFVSVLLLLEMMPMTTGAISPFDGGKHINENSTLLHPLMNATQNVTLNVERTDSTSFDDLPWWCYYSSDLEENENESECHCEGPQLIKIPQNLPLVTRLSIANAKFKVLREAGLRRYSTSLRDL